MSGRLYQWDRQPEEPLPAYARFLTYRNLGPARTVQKAYDSHLDEEEKAKKHSAGVWAKECWHWKWVDRATAWDVHNLTLAGKKAVTRFMALIERMALRALEAMEKETLAPTSWQQVLDTANALSALIPHEAIIAAGRSDHDGDSGPPRSSEAA